MAISPTQKKLHERKLIHTVLKIIHKLILLTLPYAILCYILIPIYCF
jgi:ABC-type methionine transport system permease subunit